MSFKTIEKIGGFVATEALGVAAIGQQFLALGLWTAIGAAVWAFGPDILGDPSVNKNNAPPENQKKKK